MKIFSVAAVLASVVSLSNAYHYDAQRMLILGGETGPSSTKTYMASLRLTEDGNTYCGGALISLTHVLTASHCSVYHCRWVSIGSHYRNGTEDGEHTKIVSMMNHPNYSENVEYSNDFMVVELERPSKFQPVKLAAAGDSDFKPGKMATTMS